MACASVGVGKTRSSEPIDLVGGPRSSTASVCVWARPDTSAPWRAFRQRVVDAAMHCAGPVAGIDTAVAELLGALGESFALDGCVACLASETQRGMYAHCVWSRAPHLALGDRFDLIALPWVMAKTRTVV